MIKDFKPAIFFLLRFLGVYLIGNILYGFYIESYQDKPDSATYVMARHTSWLLNQCGEITAIRKNPYGPTMLLHNEYAPVLNFFEGCNGLNVMIVFLAFMAGFGGNKKNMIWFIPAGLVVIYLSNLGRLTMLYYVAEYYQSLFYYVHKYLFTAILYVIVFGLWALWIMKYGRDTKNMEHEAKGS